MPFHPSEFVFLMDCSGSISGKNIQAAADMLIMCIKSLPEGSFFNVITFGSTFIQRGGEGGGIQLRNKACSAYLPTFKSYNVG